MNFFEFSNAAFIFFIFQIFWIILLLSFHFQFFWIFELMDSSFFPSEFPSLDFQWRKEKPKNSQTYIQSTSFTYSLFSDSSLREFIDFRANKKQTRYLRGHVRNITIHFILLFIIFSSVGDIKSVKLNPPPFLRGSTAKKSFFYFRLSWVYRYFFVKHRLFF